MSRLHFVFMTLAGLWCSFAIHAQDLYSAKSTEAFANYLFTKGDYGYAAEEYSRLLFMHPSDDSVLIRLSQSYRKLNQYERACQVITEHRTPNGRSQGVEKELLSALIFQKDSMAFVSALGRFRHLDSSTLLRSQVEFSILTRHWEVARDFVKSSQVSNFPWSPVYQENIEAVLAFRPKKPWLASVYSAIIPGTGKIYSNNVKEGITSFLFVGALAYQSYRGFHKRGTKSFTGWLYGGLSFGFYLGNIYGAQQSAKNYNARNLNRIYHEVDQTIYSRH
ncbi:MAG: hypothetical protein HKN76_05935 [Saprospiraceae bacterium]|nr:hypothetical protein [Saprospiraceae bacterium]